MGAIAKLEFKLPGTSNRYFYSEAVNYEVLQQLFEEFVNIPESDLKARYDFIKSRSEDFMKISLGYLLVPVVTIVFNKGEHSEDELDKWEGLFNDIHNQLKIMDDKELFDKFLELKERHQEEAKELAKATREFLFALFLIARESQFLNGRLTNNHFEILDEILSNVEDLFDEIMLHDYYRKLEDAMNKYISKTLEIE